MGDTLDRSGRTKIGPEVALRGWDGSGVAATPRGRRRQSRDGSRPRYLRGRGALFLEGIEMIKDIVFY